MTTNPWDERFQSNQYSYGKEPNEFIKEKSIFFPEGAHIASFAEGEGRNAVFLAKQGYTVTAYDYSKVGLHHAELLAKENNVTIETVEADLTKVAVPEHSYDGAMMVFGHVEKEKQQFFLENIFRSVKKGGYIMFEVYSVRQLAYGTGGPRNLDLLYDPIDILEWTKPFHVVHFFYGEVERQEGTLHTGVGHVIQTILFKK